MGDVDGYLATCGPAFLAHELDREQLRDQQNLDQLVVESDVLFFTEAERLSTHEVTISRRLARFRNDQQQTNRSSSKASVVEEVSAPVPVTHGKRGLCYDVNQLSDTKRRNRLLKNRESADQSRKRKLEGAKQYELLLKELTEENKRLRDANRALVHRVAEMQETLVDHDTAILDDAQPMP
jgi:hypothetical protein